MSTVLSGLVKRWLSREGLPGWALLVVMGVAIGLFVDYHQQRWQKSVQAAKRQKGAGGEGLVICHNGLGYYAWLRSLLVDGDWSFDNEFDEHGLPGDYVPPPGYRTPIGRRANQWSAGPACVWAVSVIPVHLILKTFEGKRSPWPADGYSLPYQVAVGVTSLLLSFFGLWLTYAICRTVARPSRAALAAALLWLGTTIVYYGAVEVSGAHGLGTTATALLVWYWLRTYGSLEARRWLVVGALVGAAALMRWQLATFAILPAGEAGLGYLRVWRSRNVPELSRLCSGTAWAAVGAMVAFFPQMLAWRSVYGSWLACPIPGIAANWLNPSWGQVLWSQDRSLFYWTPIAGAPGRKGAPTRFFRKRTFRPRASGSWPSRRLSRERERLSYANRSSTASLPATRLTGRPAAMAIFQLTSLDHSI